MTRTEITSSNPNLPITRWGVEDMRRETTTDVVREVEWYLSKTNFEIHLNRTGVVNLSGSNSDPDFIPFDDLTQSTVLGWITGSLDTASIYLDLSSSFESTVTQSTVIQTPW